MRNLGLWPSGGDGAAGNSRTSAPDTRVFVSLQSFTAQVTSNCPRVLADLATLYACPATVGHQPAGPVAMQFAVVEHRPLDADPFYRLYEADRETYVFASASVAVACLEHLLNVAAAAHLTRRLLIHAGAVVGAGGGVILPAASGAGKSTLVAALCLNGFKYLSDELAVLEEETLGLLPFLKAICLKDGGWRRLTASFDVPPALLHSYRGDSEEVRYFAAPGRCSPEDRIQVRYVLLPDRRAGSTANLAPCSRALTLTELARHSLNLQRHGLSGVEVLARLVEGADCYVLTYDDLRDAVAAISGLVAQ